MMLLPRLFLILFAFTGFASGAQESGTSERKQLQYDSGSRIHKVDFDQAKLEEFREQPAFDYVKETVTDNWWTRFKRWLQLKYQQLLNSLFGDYQANALLALFLKTLPYLIIAAVIAFAVWLFIRLNPGASLLERREQPGVILQEEEKILRSEDIQGLIDNAVKKGNYRLAIRYSYLQLLQQLNNMELISYDFQKTNSDYLREMRKENLKQPLQHIMRIYDFIWYGSFALSEEEFEKARKNFSSIQQKLKTYNDE